MQGLYNGQSMFFHLLCEENAQKVLKHQPTKYDIQKCSGVACERRRSPGFINVWLSRCLTVASCFPEPLQRMKTRG